MDRSDETIVKVSSSSVTSNVAGAIAGIMREKNHVIVQAIEASAVNQAVSVVDRPVIRNLAGIPAPAQWIGSIVSGRSRSVPNLLRRRWKSPR